MCVSVCVCVRARARASLCVCVCLCAKDAHSFVMFGLVHPHMTCCSLFSSQLGPEAGLALGEALKGKCQYVSISYVVVQGWLARLRLFRLLWSDVLWNRQRRVKQRQLLMDPCMVSVCLMPPSHCLRLDHNQLGDSGIKALASALRKNTSLSRL